MSFPEFLFVLLLFRSAKLSALLQQICENSQLLSSVEAPPLRAPTHTPTSHILTGSPSETARMCRSPPPPPRSLMRPSPRASTTLLSLSLMGPRMAFMKDQIGWQDMGTQSRDAV